MGERDLVDLYIVDHIAHAFKESKERVYIHSVHHRAAQSLYLGILEGQGLLPETWGVEKLFEELSDANEFEHAVGGYFRILNCARL